MKTLNSHMHLIGRSNDQMRIQKIYMKKPSVSSPTYVSVRSQYPSSVGGFRPEDLESLWMTKM